MSSFKDQGWGMAIKGSRGSFGLKVSDTRRLDGPRDKGLEGWRGDGEAMGDGELATEMGWEEVKRDRRTSWSC